MSALPWVARKRQWAVPLRRALQVALAGGGARPAGRPGGAAVGRLRVLPSAPGAGPKLGGRDLPGERERLRDVAGGARTARARRPGWAVPLLRPAGPAGAP